ncbi:RagB/SusD family nutrient uptake outer membrane protein [Aequorivita sp. SDUM287046]|uniref:RagB/SusD family nutrient uptake outer membrane protein n=1 Tax=Aequorivita aurantiaca TaxID=3053356 RepID=A0ABT8DHQ6_9FLAO|nr:RagB/SusD family nutrient uptake outer membrane protein [Aequorivita aurantiaca]MDN3724314.1 RagB/SusD family nutrient uptake outer membrane protein [Aequorivita aurantiaca]
MKLLFTVIQTLSHSNSVWMLVSNLKKIDKMKKIIYKIAVLTLVIGGFTSCDNELDQIPFDSLATSQAYITASDFENAARGIYSTLTNASLYGGSDAGGMLDAPDVLADNVTLASKGRGSRRTLHNWQYSASTEPMSGLYERSYQMIFRANTLLEQSVSFEGTNKEKVVAEAKALRALGHLNLATFFAKLPTQSADANSSPGVAYVTTADFSIEPARLSVGETYDMIVQDLKDALVGIPATSEPGRLNADGVNTLLSRTYLYMGQWQNSIDAANAVTKAVAPRNTVVGVWEDVTKDGVIFWIDVDPPGLDITPGVTWSQFGVNTLVPEYVVSYPLFQLFEDDDIRKDAYTLQARNGPSKYNAIKKLFAREDGQFPGRVDIKILRAAESKLNIAEAQYNLGNEAAALAALDAVRSKRYASPPTGETGTALRDAIRLERRLEFAFESQRFFDLKRWALPVERGGFGDLNDGTGVPSEAQNLAVGSKFFQLPIPQTAMDLNPNLEQNSGY